MQFVKLKYFRRIAAHFNSRGRWRERLPSILDTLVALGRIHAQSAALWVNVG